MPRINNQYRKADLALALASGGTATKWAEDQGIPTRTAQSWAVLPEVAGQVEAIRASMLDQAIGLLSRKAADAARQITDLAADAGSESVRLQAARAVLTELLRVSTYASLEHRLVEIERRLAERGGAEGEWASQSITLSSPNAGQGPTDPSGAVPREVRA